MAAQRSSVKTFHRCFHRPLPPYTSSLRSFLYNKSNNHKKRIIKKIKNHKYYSFHQQIIMIKISHFFIVVLIMLISKKCYKAWFHNHHCSSSFHA